MTIIIRQISLTLAIIFLSSNHPLTLGFILIATRIIFSILIFLNSRTAWISYIVIIVFLRGSIVIFIYITSISSNETIFIDLNYIYLLLFSNLFFFIYSINTSNVLYNLKNLNSLNTIVKNNSIEIVYKTYSYRLRILTLFIIIYLLLIIIVAVKVTVIVKSPIRR